MSALTPRQEKFASVFAAETGLNPKVVGAWLLAEQSGSAAKYYERKGINNWLNIGNVDSSPQSGNRFSVWKDPVTAAKESAAWMRGQGKLAHEYGKPASGIMHILSSAGQGPHRQIQAIARSGWASSGYNGGTTLSQLMGQVGNIQPARGEGMAGRAQSASASSPELAYGKGNPALGTIGALLFPGQGAGDQALRAAFQQRGAEPSQSIRMNTSPGSGAQAAPSGGGGYVSAVPGGALGRTDMGLDISATPGTHIRAIGDSKVTGIYPNWYKGQPYVELQFINGPRAGQSWYVAEQIDPHVRPGQTVRRGESIGRVAGTGTGLELGFGAGKGRTRAQATTGYNEGEQTGAGKAFTQFYRGLRG